MRAVPLLTALLLSTPALAEPPRIVTDMGVTGSLVQQVLGDLGEALPLLEKGADPHDFQMRPSQARALQDADLLIWMGPQMIPSLDEAADQMGEDRNMVLLDVAGTQLYAPAGHAEHEHDHDHDHGAEGSDPHGWLSPENGHLWLDAIAERLAAADPENAAQYRENAAAAHDALDQTVAEIRQTLPQSVDLPFVVFHDAYGNFTSYFGLPDAIAVTLGDASAPSAARLTEVHHAVTESGAVCAFPETGHPLRMIETAIEGTPARLGEELSPTGADVEYGSTLYNEILQRLATRISACYQAAAQ